VDSPIDTSLCTEAERQEVSKIITLLGNPAAYAEIAPNNVNKLLRSIVISIQLRTPIGKKI